jgi:hypothetical protein
MSRDEQKMKLLAEVQRLSGENIELEAERDTLRKAYDLSNATNSRLVAHVDRLCGVASVVAAELRPVLPLCALQLDCAVAETPAQSVAHIEAAALRRFCEEMGGKALYVSGDATGGVLWICTKGRERADRIERGSKP